METTGSTTGGRQAQKECAATYGIDESIKLSFQQLLSKLDSKSYPIHKFSI